ncbi:purine-binding chemotaxis protein CheW [Pseudomonas corrugata]|uniref:Purine-binding chemotaxis protein CheW n=1 Tax=Pseudomonas corrugata TaxID=47879 RepID=A0A7Y6DF77_9PSED|nr:chemotaxis protein CheW [Pseudomonas corrugata]NUT85197.1 purine-binding chemotaxis protein CheW [Pseudomonas corrugata]
MSISASRLPTPGTAAPQYLTFSVGREMFAVGTLCVREIVEYGLITPLPMAPPTVRGITNLRGAAIPVLDLGLCFGGAPTLENPRTCIVMLEVRGSGVAGLVGIIVDAVSEVLEIPAEQIEPAPALQGRLSPAFVVGIGKLSDHFVLLLDIEHLLNSDDWTALDHSDIDAGELKP